MKETLSVELLGGNRTEFKPSAGAGWNKYDVSLFAASCDTAETNEKYAKALKLDYPILSDPEKKTAREYGVVTKEREFPSRYTYYIGKDGKILHIDKEVKPDTHGKDVAARLKELGVDEKKSDKDSDKK